MNVYTQGDDFALCKEVLPGIANLNDYEIKIVISSLGMPPIIEASTTPTGAELKVHKRSKLGWFVNIPSSISQKLFPERYNLQVTYENISTSTKRTYDYSAIFLIKSKLD